MSNIRQHLKSQVERARIARYNRSVAMEGTRQSRAAAHVERTNSGAMNYI